MPEGQVLEFSGLTKHFGAVHAVSQLSARVEPGMVTGFLGPNGAGKTTTLRILLGLIRADAGTARIGGADYRTLANPLQTVGAVLEASSFHPGRSAANHLKAYAQAAGLPVARVGEVLGLVGLADAAGRKVGGYSLGMRQRLGLAYALLGDPGVLVLDEPTNGLDPEGIKWLRGFLRELAREGRTVLVSSHLLAEVQQTVDALLIITHGRGVFQGGLHELTDPSEFATVVDSPDRDALTAALRDADLPFEVLRSGLTVRGADPAAVGLVAAAAGVPLSALQQRGPALEEIFLDLVNGVRVHEKVPGAATTEAIAEEEQAVVIDDTAATAPEAATVDARTAGTPAAGDPLPDEAAGNAPGDAPVGVPATDEVDAATAEVDAATADTGRVVVVAGEEVEAAGGLGEAAEAAADPVDIGAPPEPSAEASRTPEPAAFSVASTGIIDIVREDESSADRDPPPGSTAAETADLVDAPEAEASDRPWESTERTEADLEADRFFAAFDDEDDDDDGETVENESDSRPADGGEHR